MFVRIPHPRSQKSAHERLDLEHSRQTPNVGYHVAHTVGGVLWPHGGNYGLASTSLDKLIAGEVQEEQTNAKRYWTKAVEPVYPDHTQDSWRRFMDQTGLETDFLRRPELVWTVFEGINDMCVHNVSWQFHLDTTLTVKQCFSKSK